MNQNILKKCIDELKKAPAEGSDLPTNSPNIQYVLGMLETLYEMQTPVAVKAAYLVPGQTITIPPATTEAEIMDARARAALDEIKRLAPDAA